MAIGSVLMRKVPMAVAKRYATRSVLGPKRRRRYGRPLIRPLMGLGALPEGFGGFSPMVEQWRPLFEQMAPDLPTDFLLKWITMESAGNPCSVGMPGREAGIFQTDHPGDDKYGATFDALRAACIGGSQQASRALTDDEKVLQVQDGLGLVRDMANKTTTQLASVGSSWDRSSADFWTMVKQQHALPVVLDLLPVFAKVNGRGPDSWKEFRDFATSFPPSQMPSSVAPWAGSYPSQHGLSSRMEDTLANAEEAGAYGGGFVDIAANVVGVPSSYLKVALLGFIAYGIWKLA